MFNLLKNKVCFAKNSYVIKIIFCSILFVILIADTSISNAFDFSVSGFKNALYSLINIILVTLIIFVFAIALFLSPLTFIVQKIVDFLEKKYKISYWEIFGRPCMSFEIWASDFFAKYGMKVLVSVLIVVIGIFLVRKTNKVLSVFWKKSNIDSSLTGLVNYLVKFILYILIVLSVLKQFGSVWDIITPLSASILAVSVVFKENISNFVSGIFIVLYQPIHVGDHISISSVSGTVVQIGHSFTSLHTSDNTCVVIPNAKIMNEILTRTSKWDVSPMVMTLKISRDKKGDNPDEKFLEYLKNTIESDILMRSSCVIGSPAPKLEFTNSKKFPLEATLTVWVSRKCDIRVIKSIGNLTKNKFPELLFDISLQQNVESTM